MYKATINSASLRNPLLYPLPVVMVSCGMMNMPNIITVAWTGIINSEPQMTYISIRRSRFSHDIILGTGRFVINLVSEKLVRAADFCGTHSGRDTDKFSTVGLTPEKGSASCPIIKESPVNIECVLDRTVELPSHDMFIANIESVHLDNILVRDIQHIDFDKAGLVVYNSRKYYNLGRCIGKFGFSANHD